MRKSIMKNKGKKIVAVALSLVMMIPLVLGQTVETKAAAKTVNDVLSLDLDASSSKTFTRGDTILLNIKAKETLTASKIGFHLMFKDSGNAVLKNAFTLNKVTVASGWYAGYDADKLQFVFSSSSIQTIAASSTIAQIELTVKKEITTTATAVMAFEDSSLDLYLADGTPVTGTTPADDITLKLTSSITGNRGVELELPATQEQTIYTFGGNGNNSLRKFSVPVTMKNNTGFNAITIQFEYDNLKMSYKGYELSPKALLYLNCITEFQGVKTNTAGSTVGYVSLSFAGLEDTKMMGDFLTLTFETGASARDGDSATITPTITELVNASETPNLSGTANKCIINFKKGYERGDVNQDHRLSLLDVTYALQGYNNVRKLSPEQESLADVNGDGKLTLVDVLMILKKCNGENISFA